MWTWEQTKGHMLAPDGSLKAVGYSGSPEGKNDPTKQDMHNVGPIPQGKYTIGFVGDTHSHGPYVLSLTPDEQNNMFGRSGFLIHGDSKEHPGAASEGCIILPLAIRQNIWLSNDHELQVIA